MYLLGGTLGHDDDLSKPRGEFEVPPSEWSEQIELSSYLRLNQLHYITVAVTATG